MRPLAPPPFSHTLASSESVSPTSLADPPGRPDALTLDYRSGPVQAGLPRDACYGASRELGQGACRRPVRSPERRFLCLRRRLRTPRIEAAGPQMRLARHTSAGSGTVRRRTWSNRGSATTPTRPRLTERVGAVIELHSLLVARHRSRPGPSTGPPQYRRWAACRPRRSSRAAPTTGQDGLEGRTSAGRHLGTRWLCLLGGQSSWTPAESSDRRGCSRSGSRGNLAFFDAHVDHHISRS